ncbi:hypothetical protein [Lentzea sp. CC55]|uniref:hypothetical protein n=1 Tax=Lentzea sp. CC55 TaxID=2884909 RepID=UPI001F2B4600|nr:hypothetical protein [Lentzea sp. CC55]MCG8927272.1 hypothetical protein [Lentzea sp. CC55]
MGTARARRPRARLGRYLKARVLSVVGVVGRPVPVHRLTGSAGWASVVTAAEAGRKVIAEPS